MSKVIFENLTPEQAKTLANWFEGQGEQDCYDWFETHGIKSPTTDCSRKDGCMTISPNGDVTLYCK
jgi:hypothetical protein